MSENQNQRTPPRSQRTVSDSRTEQVHIVLPMDVNANFGLFGGKLMEWIDIVAAVVARRHCGHQVTTAAVDQLEFLAPARLNDIVVLRGRMTYAGNTSMEVCVETYVEEAENWGTSRLVNRAYLTMVALDYQCKPTVVPLLVGTTEEEAAELDAAKMRVGERRSGR